MKLKKTNCDEAQKLKLRQNSKIQMVMKLKKSNCDKTKTLYCHTTPVLTL